MRATKQEALSCSIPTIRSSILESDSVIAPCVGLSSASRRRLAPIVSFDCAPLETLPTWQVSLLLVFTDESLGRGRFLVLPLEHFTVSTLSQLSSRESADPIKGTSHNVPALP